MTRTPPPWDAGAFRTAIQSSLDAFVEHQARQLAPLGEDAGRLVQAARGSVSGGKRLRAAFCFWGYRAVQPDVPDEPALLRASAALELLHASALVHDDYMDSSDTRRGRPATHKAFEALHRQAGWTGRNRIPKPLLSPPERSQPWLIAIFSA